MGFIRIFLCRLRFKRTLSSKEEGRNIVDSMVKARKLYIELSLAAHPDRHPNKKEIAEEIMQRVTANKHNYAALNSLQEEILEKLG